MNVWQLLFNGVPSQGSTKHIYDKQRKSREEYKERANKQKVKRYKKDPEKYRVTHQNYKARFVEKYGLEAWNARQRQYAAKFRAKNLHRNEFDNDN